MIKASFAGAAMLVLAPLSASAQPVLSDESCDLLARLVKQRVHLAATQVSMDRAESSSLRRAIDVAATTRHVCTRTAEITTRAFGEALAALNMQIGWEPPHPGDYCWSGNLDQCYPGLEPGDPRLPANRLAFVYDAWQGVRDAVQSQIPGGAAGGVAVFSVASLDAALASRLGETVEGPLHSSYAGR